MPESTGSTEETKNAKGAASTPTKQPRVQVSSIRSNGHDPFVLPVLHLSVPEAAINLGFWGALVGAAALGTIELPVVALIGAGVLVARHNRSR